MKSKLNYTENHKIDFEIIENKLGFKLHEDLKEFYNKNSIYKHDSSLEIHKKHLINSIELNVFFKDWFKEDNELLPTSFEPNIPIKDFYKYFIHKFDQKNIYGYDDINFDKRCFLGDIETNVGMQTLIFNNTTGKIEWYDYEYGADKLFDNPHGIIANTIKDYIKLIKQS